MKPDWYKQDNDQQQGRGFAHYLCSFYISVDKEREKWKGYKGYGHCGLSNYSDLNYKALCHSSYVNPGSLSHTGTSVLH